MTPQEIELVETTWAQLAGSPDAAAALFYGTLFAGHPELRPLFRSDPTEQGRKLMQTLAFVVAGLRRPETILGAVEKLGVRHRGYGVRPEHYPFVGDALIATLRTGLGDGFGEAAEKAWAEAVGLLAGVMIRAAESAAAPVS